MKIIHVISGLTKGGGERVAVELANQAVQMGDSVTLLVGWPEDPEFLQNKIHPSVQLKFVAPSKKLAYLKIIPWVIRNKKWICSNDVLHCHLTFGSLFGTWVNIILRFLLRHKNPIIVETNHAVGMLVPNFSRWLHSRMSLHCDGMALMAEDKYWGDFIKAHPSLTTAIIFNGISPVKPIEGQEYKTKQLHQFGIPDTCRYLIGTISMLRPDRNPQMYVPLFKQIRQALGDEAHFILGGGGLEFDKIAKMVEDEGLTDHFHMIGLVSEPVSVFSVVDVYVSISMGEAAGISMIEAAMCKLPVVGIQLREQYKMKESDWVWSNPDLSEVAMKIITLLQNDTERIQMAVTQNKYVTTYLTSEAVYNAYNHFYKKIMRNKGLNQA